MMNMYALRSGQLDVLLRRLESNCRQTATATVARQRIRKIIDAAGHVSDVATRLRLTYNYDNQPTSMVYYLYLDSPNIIYGIADKESKKKKKKT